MSCDRFEREGLERLERGLPLDPHFETCPDCRRQRAAYERLGAAIRETGADLEPPADWEAQVRATIDSRRVARRYRSRSRWLAPAAAAAVLVFLLLRPPEPVEMSLAVRVEAGATVRRGEEANLGDRLVLEANAGPDRHAELRVYRNDRQLVLHCSNEPPCIRRGDTLQASLPLDAPGTYQSVLLSAEEPLPAPAHGLDADTAAALDAGASFELGTEIEVR